MTSLHNPRRLARMRSALPQLVQLAPSATAASLDGLSAPPTSGMFDNASSTTIARFDLEKTFPAILAPFSLLLKIPESEDIDALRALAPVFAHCLNTILHSMAHLPEHIPTSPKYHIAMRAVIFSKDMFLDHVNRIPLHEPSSPSRREAIQVAMQFLDTTMSSLKSFLNTAAYEAAQLKPLPQIPSENLPTESGVSSSPSKSSTEIHQLDLNTRTLESHSTEALDQSQTSKDPPSLDPPSLCCRARKRPSYLELASRNSATSSTLINNESDDLGYVHVSINIRNSLAHFPVSIDPTAGVIPHPEDATELWKDRNGLVQLASLKALVRYMTGPDVDSDIEIVDVFFLCFRFFSTPMETFDALVARYDEDPCQPSDIARSYSMQVKIRIARLLYLWVDLHWRADDAEVLTPLTRFALSCLAQDIPREASLKLVSTLHRRACAGEKSKGLRKEKTIARAEAKYRREVLRSTWEPREKKSMMKHDFSRVKLEHFHSPGGHAMLALQITLLLWDKYRAFEPEDAIQYLMTRNGDNNRPTSEVASKVEIFMAYERAVHRFVMNNIGSAQSVQKRTERTEFFLELATKCHELRNYSASCLIALACDRPTVLPFVTKMKLSPAHERMKAELRDFYTRENHHMGGYKEALQRCNCPAVPGMMLFIREVARGCGSGPYDQHPEYPGPRLINLKRYRPITWAVRAMEKCHTSFKIQRVDYICDWLEHVLSEYLVGTEMEWEERIYNNCRQL